MIDELSVLARDLPDGASGVLNRAIELIEHLLENQIVAPQDDGHLKMLVTQLIATLRDVSMALVTRAPVPFTTIPTPEQAERRSKPRGVNQPMNWPPCPSPQAGWGEPPH